MSRLTHWLTKAKEQISLGEKAYTISSPEHCKTYNKSPHTMTEQTKQPPQHTKNAPQTSAHPYLPLLLQRDTNKLER
jgi:hypothetical protein